MRRHESELPGPPADDRPNDRWQCGQACDGSGIGSCHSGPSPRGRCGSATRPCRPVQTFQGRRPLVITGVTLCGIVVLAAATLLKPQTFYKPGPLSRAHALILSETGAGQRCAACHEAASVSIADWFSTAGSGHRGVTQSDRCMDCHHVDIPAPLATSPHNLSRQRLEQIRLALAEAPVDSAIPSPTRNIALRNTSSSDEAIHCAACHREHRGADVNLSLLSNEQCQSCHSRTFHSFADGHPQWDQWPYRGEASIAFNHATHAGMHFPKAVEGKPAEDETPTPGRQAETWTPTPGGQAKAWTPTPGGQAKAWTQTGGRAFDCGACHRRGDSGEPLRTVDYRTACADCHDEALRQRSGERIDLLALPSLSDDAAAEAEPWPAAATGFFDGEVSPLLRWLLSLDPHVAAALARLPLDGNLTSIEGRRADQQRAATQIAIATREVLDELALQGVATQRLDTATGGPQGAGAAAAESMRRLLRGVSPQLLWDARVRWFGTAPLPSVMSSPTADSLDRQPQANDSPVIAQTAATDDLLGDDDLLSGDDLLGGEHLLGGDTEFGGVDALQADLLRSHAPANPLLGSERQLRAGGFAPQRKASEQRFDPVTMLPDGGWYRDDVRMSISYRGGGHADPVLRAAIELAASLPDGDRVRRDLMKSTAIKACIECHPGALSSTGVRWHSGSTRDAKSVFTRFSHRPHFHLPQLNDCTHCHQVSHVADQALGTAVGHGFSALQKDNCATCHQRGSAGDNCTQCHLYHGKP